MFIPSDGAQVQWASGMFGSDYVNNRSRSAANLPLLDLTVYLRLLAIVDITPTDHDLAFADRSGAITFIRMSLERNGETRAQP